MVKLVYNLERVSWEECQSQTATIQCSLLRRGKGFFSGGVDPFSNVCAGTELQVTTESAGASARYHTQDGRHPGETIFCALLPGVACVPCDGWQDFEVQRCLRFS